MHFDEVYHARTAAEFLQDWRYDIPHDIYEWTHPHLAKYAMAVGMVLWGQDGVAATSDLEVPVVAAAVEPRRIDEAASNARAGERLHIATGTEIRTYDLQSRALISTIAAPGVSALAVDEDGGRLVVGYDDGRLATIELGLIADGAAPGAGIEPTEVATVDHPIEHLLVTEDGADVVAASSERLTTVALDSGEAVGSLDLPGIADLSPGGSGSAIVATVDDIPDHAAFATSLADILKNDKAADYQAQLDAASPGTTRRPGQRTGHRRAAEGAGRGDRRRHPRRRPDRDGRAVRRRHRRRASRSSTRSGPRSSRPSSSKAGAHGLGDGDRPRRAAGLRDDRHGRRPALRRHRRRRRRGEGRADRQGARHGPQAAARARLARRLRRGQPDGPHPRPRARRDGRRPVDRLRRRAARQRGLRRRSPARRLRPGRLGRGLQPRLPVRGPPAAPPLRRRRRLGRDRHGLARLRLALPGRHRRRPDRGAAVPARADPVPAPARGRPRSGSS